MSLTLTEVKSDPNIFTYKLIFRNGEKIIFRPLVKSDNYSLAKYLSELSLQTRRFCTYDSFDINTANKFCNSIAKYDKLRLVVLSPEKTIIGLFEYSFDLTEDDIKRFSVYNYTLNQGFDCRFGPCLADKYQNQGLGGLLFPYLVKIARKFNQKRIILWGGVLADNARAIHYYQKMGFKTVGNFTNNNGIPCVDMIFEI